VWFADVGIVLEEHVHVPEHDHSPEGAGWLIGSGFDRTRNQSFCSVFDAERLEDGPLAVAYLNGSAPMALHGEFVPLR
jgi:carotenoid cleavage dioxygenase